MNLVLILELKSAAIEIKLSLDVFNSMLRKYKKVSLNLVIRPLKFSSVNRKKKKNKPKTELTYGEQSNMPTHALRESLKRRE